MPELTWTTALAWFGVITSALTLGGLVGLLMGGWLGRRGVGGRRTGMTVLAVLLFALSSPALTGGHVRCQTHHEPTLNRLQTLCSDGTRATSSWNRTLSHWESMVIPPPLPSPWAKDQRPKPPTR